MDNNALVLFVDIRGFTTWADSTEVFARLDSFARNYAALLEAAFPRRAYYLKALGDGAMIVRDLPAIMTAEEAASVLDDTLERVSQVSQEFGRMCASFAQTIGHRADLRLGWGIVRGAVQKLDPTDYVGPDVNKSSRLCGQAHPWGVIIDQDDFPIRPKSAELHFHSQTRKLKGIGEDVLIWVTDEITTQFLTREKIRRSPEVHVAGQCIDTSSKRGLKILVARRSPERTLYPGKLEGCGGQLAASEWFTDGVERHYRLEMGIDVRVFEHIHCFYRIEEPNHPRIPGIRFLCERIGDQAARSENHSEVRWLSEKDFQNAPADQFIPGLKDQVLGLLNQYKAGRR